MTKISVIIPVYNTEKYLKKCLDSVCNQTLSDIEIICINDSSCDNSLDILNEYSKNDTRIKIINFSENKGVGCARNTGIKEAVGEFVGFVDSDDFIDLDFYEKLYNVAILNKLPYVKSKLKKINTDGTAINSPNNYYFTQGIYKREFLEQNNVYFLENCICGEDQPFILKSNFLCHDTKIADTYYHYLRHDTAQAFNKEKTKAQFDSDVIAWEACVVFICNSGFDKDPKYFFYLNKVLLNIKKYKKRLNKDVTPEYNRLILNVYNKVKLDFVYVPDDVKIFYFDIVEEVKKQVLLNSKMQLAQLRKKVIRKT